MTIRLRFYLADSTDETGEFASALEGMREFLTTDQWVGTRAPFRGAWRARVVAGILLCIGAGEFRHAY